MNRRDFLTFTSERRLRVVELSCERLYMQLLDAQLTSEQHEKEEGNASWCGEPPAAFERRTPAQLFEEIDHDLRGVDVLRITGPGWLASSALRGRFDSLVDRFQAAGGRVVLCSI